MATLRKCSAPVVRIMKYLSSLNVLLFIHSLLLSMSRLLEGDCQ
jgi:hypothetical protein